MNVAVALAGNPNSGKTTLFNALTGSNQHVGNWPGVTVERKEACFELEDDQVLLVDLPGVYSLFPYSIEERVTREYVMKSAPDVVLNIVDATNLQRNLYLTLQLMELGRPLVVALNFMDELERRGVRVDTERLSAALGAPVVAISARKRQGFDALFAAVYRQAHAPVRPDPVGGYDEATRQAARKTAKLLRLSDVGQAMQTLETADDAPALRPVLDDYIKSFAAPDSAHADGSLMGLEGVALARYRRIGRILAQSGLSLPQDEAPSASEKADRVLTHRIWALPAFLAVMALMLFVTFGAPGRLLSAAAETVVRAAYVLAARALQASGSPVWATALLTDGVIAGVGGVAAFLPQILLIFLFMALMEDSGYMARAAFIADRPLRALGLSGRSFIPLLMGFGCTTTAVIAARGVENERDRRLTILLTPFMSCGAKLPVYGVFTAAFFPKRAALVVLGLYAMGMLMLAICGLLLRRTSFAGAETPFGMELPPYRVPSPGNVLRRLRQRAGEFLRRAGTLIFAMSVLAWCLQSFAFDLRYVQNSADSMLGRLGALIAPAFAPLGFGEWQKSVALLSGLIAKEAVVSTLQVLCGASSPAQLTAALTAHFTPLSAGAFLVFVLLYTPCLSAVAAVCRETGSKKLMWLSVLMQLSAAYLTALLFYQTGRLLGGA